MSIQLREVPSVELATIQALIQTLNPTISEERFSFLLSSMQPRGYRCLGVYANEALIGICGFTIGYRFWCGKQLDLDNFIVHPDYRNQGIGESMLHWLEAFAAKEQCDIIVLDAYSHSHAAHKFYHREGYIIKGYHFTKELTHAA